ncbi:unnamed protein product [Cochlearia groenlandica]
MGIDDTLKMKYRAYKEEMCQFLATLEVILYKPGWQRAQSTRGGRIHFKGYNVTRHVVTFSVLAEMYGFAAEGQPELGNDPGLAPIIRKSQGNDGLFPTTEVGDVQRIILLPNRECTSFDGHNAIHFEPGWDHFHDVTWEPLTSVRGPRKTTRPAGPRMREYEPMPHSVYGSKLYYPGPSSAPRQPGPLQDMYMEMKRMTRWSLFQDRAIRKLVREVKSLKKTIKKGSVVRELQLEPEYAIGSASTARRPFEPCQAREETTTEHPKTTNTAL